MITLHGTAVVHFGRRRKRPTYWRDCRGAEVPGLPWSGDSAAADTWVSAKQGPQDCNQIAGDLTHQLAEAWRFPAPQPYCLEEAERLAATVEAYPELFAPVLEPLIASAVKRYVEDIMGGKS